MATRPRQIACAKLVIPAVFVKSRSVVLLPIALRAFAMWTRRDRVGIVVPKKLTVCCSSVRRIRPTLSRLRRVRYSMHLRTTQPSPRTAEPTRRSHQEAQARGEWTAFAQLTYARCSSARSAVVGTYIHRRIHLPAGYADVADRRLLYVYTPALSLPARADLPQHVGPARGHS